MKNWKKLLCLLFSAVFAVSVFSFGCSKSPDAGDETEEIEVTEEMKQYTYKGVDIMKNLGSSTGTVKFMVGGDTAELQIWTDLIADFQNKNPGITVQKVVINDFDQLYQKLSAGNAPDVIQIPSHKFGNWARNYALQSLQPLVERDSYDKSDFWEQLITMFSFNKTNGVRGNGDLFALPKDMGIPGIFVNRGLVDAAKSQGRISQAEYNKVTDQYNPMTFDEYLTIAKKLTVIDSNNASNSVYGSNRIYWESYLWSAGDDILKDNQLNTNSELFKKTVEYSKSMVDKSSATYCAPYFSSNSADTSGEQEKFMSHKLAMFWAGRWCVPAFDKANATSSSPVNYYCIPLPVATKADGSKGESITFCSTVGYGVARNCKNGEMAWKLIKYLASKDAYRIMNRLNYNVPGRKSLITESAFTNPAVPSGCKSTIDAASQAIFFRMAPKARINNASRLSSDAWINNFESKLDLFFTGEIKSFDELMSKSKIPVNNAIKRSDPQLF